MNNINFHLTFPPTLEYISRLLELPDMCNELSKEEISELTGIPTGKSSGKVEPHINYGIYMGLIDNISTQKNKYMLKRTKLGHVIQKEDLGLHEEITQLLCHIHLTSPTTGAFLWQLLIRHILPNYPDGIKLLILEDELRKQPVLAKRKRINLGPFYSTYEKSFTAFSLISRTKERIKLIPQTFKSEFIYVYAYALLYEWENLFGRYTEITATQLTSLRFATAFGLTDSMAYSVLERFAEKGIVRINGQLSPYTVIKNAYSYEMIDKAYSLLF
jgi:hypothetical protein